MSNLKTPLSPTAISAYHQYIVDTILAGDPADAAAIATAIETYDESAAVQKERWRQLKRSLQEDFMRNAPIGQVLTATVTDRGRLFAVGDVVNVTTTTGSGAYITITETKVYLETVLAIAAGGSGYTVDDILTTVPVNSWDVPPQLKVATVGGSGEVTSVTIEEEGTGNSGTLDETSVPVTGGTGTNALFNLNASVGGMVTATIHQGGSGYTASDTATTITTTSGASGAVVVTCANPHVQWVETAIDALIAA